MAAAIVFAYASRHADAQLVFAYPTYTYDLRRFDAALNEFVAPLPVSLEVHAMAADAQGLYIACNRTLYRWLYGANGPTLVGTFSGAVPSIAGGLAWDSTRGVLYGTGGTNLFDQSKLVSIDPVTCVTTLVRALPGTKMSGMDYDAPRNRLLFTQDRSGVFDGIGFYALAWPYDTAAPTRIAPYQHSWQVDVDGVAVGGGYAWLVCDEAEWLYKFNLETNQFETPIVMVFNQHQNISVGATWAPGMMDPVEHDLAISLAGPAVCDVTEGGSATLVATAQHIGGTQATTGVKVAFTLPAGIDPDSVRSVPTGAWDVQGRWSVTIGTLAAGASQAISVTVDHVPPGELIASAAISGTQTDPRPNSNSASTTVRVREIAGAAANGVGLGVQVMASTVLDDANSLLASVAGDVGDARHRGLGAGLESARLITLGVDARGARGVSRSPDGVWILAHATLDTGDSVLLRFRSDGSEPARIVARANVGPALTMAEGSFAPTHLESAAINDDGLVGLAMRADDKAVLARIDNDGVTTVVLEEGATELVAIGPGATPAGLIQSPVVGEYGQLACIASINGVPTSVDRAIFADDGSRVVAQEGVTLPWGQVDADGFATFHLLRALDEGVPGLRLQMDGFLNSWIAPGAIAASQSVPANSGVDRVLMQGAGFGSAGVVAQENVPLSLDFDSGPLGNLEPLSFCAIDATGTWWAGVRRRDGTSALLRNGLVAAQSGDAAWPDGPNWASVLQPPESGQGAGASALAGFAHALEDGADGAIVVVGHVESDSPRRDGVAVLGGFGPVLRENESIIGDGSSTRHVAEIVGGGASVSLRDAVLLVSLRERVAAEACATDAMAGMALVRVPIASACPSCAADYDDNGGVDGGDLGAFFADFEAGEMCADVDDNGGIDGGDLGAFFQAFEAGGC
jgi:hypothetical protein